MKDEAALVRELDERLRAGAVFYDCDTDGDHCEIAFRDGRFEMREGFRGGTRAPTTLPDANAVAKIILNVARRNPGPVDDLAALALAISALR